MDRDDRYSRGYSRRSAHRDSRSYRRSRSPYRSSHRPERNDLTNYLKEKMARLQEGISDSNGVDHKHSESSRRRDHDSEERKNRSRHRHDRDERRSKDKGRKHRKKHRHHREKERKENSDEAGISPEHSDFEMLEEEDEEALIERRRQERQKLLENLGYKTDSPDINSSPKEEPEEIDIIPEDSLMKTNTKPMFKSESAIFADSVDSSPNGRMSGVQAPAAVAFLHEHPTTKAENNADKKPEGEKKFAFDIFSGEVPTAPANGVPGIMDPRAMASENHALADNWDDAEGYYCKFTCAVSYSVVINRH